MYDKRSFRGQLKFKVYLSLFSVWKHMAVLLLGAVLTFVIYHSKWYSARETVTPYIAAFIYTPLYLFCQTKISLPLPPHVITRVTFADRLKLAAADSAAASLIWGLFLTAIQICLTNNLGMLLIMQKLVLAVLYFMVVSGLINIVYVYTKNAGMSFSLVLIILLLDYYLSAYKGFMGVKGVILYSVFAGTSFLKSGLILFLLNILFTAVRFYLYYYNYDVLKWEIR